MPKSKGFYLEIDWYEYFLWKTSFIQLWQIAERSGSQKFNVWRRVIEKSNSESTKFVREMIQQKLKPNNETQGVFELVFNQF